MVARSRVIPTPPVEQERALDCEAAALQVALAGVDVRVSQGWTLGVARSLRLLDVAHATFVTLPMDAFEAAWESFGRMAVVV